MAGTQSIAIQSNRSNRDIATELTLQLMKNWTSLTPEEAVKYWNIFYNMACNPSSKDSGVVKE